MRAISNEAYQRYFSMLHDRQNKAVNAWFESFFENINIDDPIGDVKETIRDACFNAKHKTAPIITITDLLEYSEFVYVPKTMQGHRNGLFIKYPFMSTKKFTLLFTDEHQNIRMVKNPELENSQAYPLEKTAYEHGINHAGIVNITDPEEHYRKFIDELYRALSRGFEKCNFRLSDFDDEWIDQTNSYSNPLARKIYQTLQTKNQLALATYASHLNTLAFGAMQQAQIYNPVFYNWLNGMPLGADNEREATTFYPEDDLHEWRCNFVMQNPPLGFLIATFINADKGFENFVGLMPEGREGHEIRVDHVVNFINTLDYEVTPFLPILKSPRFWRGHEYSLEILCKNLWPDRNEPLTSWLNDTFIALQTQNRQRTSTPRLISGGAI